MKFVRFTALAASLLLSLAAHAESLVVNGSLTGPIANMGTPTGWTALAGTPDTMDASNNMGVSGFQYFGANPSASPDGGTWVGLAYNAGINYVEQMGQTLTGLVVGQSYTVSWFVGNFGYDRGSVKYLGSNAIDVLIDGISVGHGATLGVSSNWLSESLTFTASSTSQQISFKLAGQETSYLSIDGIAVNTSVAPPVPEPSAWAMMGVGLVGVGVMARRRNKAAQASA